MNIKKVTACVCALSMIAAAVTQNTGGEKCSELTEITIPESVTSIEGGAFTGTPWLNNKRADNPLIVVNGILIDGATCNGSVVVPEGVTSIGDNAFEGCSNISLLLMM